VTSPASSKIGRRQNRVLHGSVQGLFFLGSLFPFLTSSPPCRRERAAETHAPPRCLSWNGSSRLFANEESPSSDLVLKRSLCLSCCFSFSSPSTLASLSLHATISHEDTPVASQNVVTRCVPPAFPLPFPLFLPLPLSARHSSVPRLLRSPPPRPKVFFSLLGVRMKQLTGPIGYFPFLLRSFPLPTVFLFLLFFVYP